jgi:aryl-alcohol dehydrogenase-like predicted oxidoreductase
MSRIVLELGLLRENRPQSPPHMAMQWMLEKKPINKGVSRFISSF